MAGTRSLGRLLADEGAQTATEYALMAALIGAAIMGAVYRLGHPVTGLYGQADAALVSHVPGGGQTPAAE